LINKLALEAEASISLLNLSEQNYLRPLVANQIKKLINMENQKVESILLLKN
jgi:hypothetical protein